MDADIVDAFSAIENVARALQARRLVPSKATSVEMPLPICRGYGGNPSTSSIRAPATPPWSPGSGCGPALSPGRTNSG